MTSVWDPRPLPEVTPETAAFWRGAAEGRLLLSECGSCGLVFHYPRALCPDCFGDDVAWREAEGTGTVHTYSWTDRVADWPDAETPVVVAYVELDEGPRLMTNLVDCTPDDVEIGTRVTVRFVPTSSDDIAIPVFEPLG